MSNERRQHLVPRCYLKNFAVKGKKEWQTYVYDKIEQKYYSPGVQNICVESEFYTFTKLPDEKKRVLEKYYGSNIEADYPNIYDLLTDPSVKKIDKKMRSKILLYVFSQFTRTSKLTNSFNEFWNRLLERGHQMIDPNGKDQSLHFENGEKIDFTNKTLREVQKEAENDNREFINLQNFNRFYDLATRRSKDLFSVYKVHVDHALITSDNPVLSTNFMFDPKSHFHLPLDEKHLILLLPFQADIDNKEIHRTNLIHEMSYIQTITNNIQQIDNAERYIIGSKSAVLKAYDDMNNLNVEEFVNRSEKFARHLQDTRSALNKVIGT
jgi:hypothetical protein